MFGIRNIVKNGQQFIKLDIQDAMIRIQPSIIRASQVIIQEIVANYFGPLNESDEVNINNVAPHIIDSKHSSTSIDYECITYNTYKQKKRSKSSESKYDPKKLGICYGLIVDIKNKKMMIKYNNKQFGKEWFELNDKRISVVTDSRKKQEIQSRVVLPSTNIYRQHHQYYQQ